MRRPSCAEIVRVTCRYLGVSREDFESPRRGKRIVFCRHLAIYLMCKMAKASYPRMGAAVFRHHTTVIHAEDKICRAIEAGNAEMELVAHKIEALVIAEIERESTTLSGSTPEGEKRSNDKEAIL